jgi:hypothetical protein
MGLVKDFRSYAFATKRLEASGKHIGAQVYWKVYCIENFLRVIINSVLTAQIGANWWNTAVDPGLAKQAANRRAQYALQPWHSQPGAHDIYCLFLPNLNEIIRANSNLFLPIIPDIDQWMARIEQIRLPRNIVGHMNWPTATDTKRIDVVFSDLKALAEQLPVSGLALRVP